MSQTHTQQLLIPIILSGGAGTRLWPVSRRAHPKPFMELVDGETLAEKTLLRAKAVAGNAPVITVTSRDYYFYTRDLYAAIKNKTGEEQFLLEPIRLQTRHSENLMGVFLAWEKFCIKHVESGAQRPVAEDRGRSARLPDLGEKPGSCQ